MKNVTSIGILVFCIAALAIAATTQGIFSGNRTGRYTHISIRGKEVPIYGKGIYRHMSAEVAPQGIAQDYVTLVFGVPLLLVAFFLARAGSGKGQFLLAGVSGYFLVTYGFYLLMGMYNALFLVYVLLTSLSFFLFYNSMQLLRDQKLFAHFSQRTPVKLTGGFLVFNAVCIALLWLSIVLPPLVDGSIIPVQVEHYTTLVVQGLDLAILLPAAFVVGVLLIKKQYAGFLWSPVYFIFLSLLMTALTAKLVAMGLLGYSIVPAIYIIPFFNAAAILCTFLLLKNIEEKNFVVYDGNSPVA